MVTFTLFCDFFLNFFPSFICYFFLLNSSVCLYGVIQQEFKKVIQYSFQSVNRAAIFFFDVLM